MTAVIIVVGILLNVAAIFFLIDGLLTRRKVLELVASRDSEGSSAANVGEDKLQAKAGLETGRLVAWHERPKVAARSNIGVFESEEYQKWKSAVSAVAPLAVHRRRISDRHVQQQLFPDIAQAPLEQIEGALQLASPSGYFTWLKPATHQNAELSLVSDDYAGEADTGYWVMGSDQAIIKPKTSKPVFFSRPVKCHKGQMWDDDVSLFEDNSFAEPRRTVSQ